MPRGSPLFKSSTRLVPRGSCLPGLLPRVALLTLRFRFEKYAQHTFSTETERRKNSGSCQSLASLLRLTEPTNQSTNMSTALNNNSTRSTVEDHDDARTSLGLFLKHLGANVMLARNAFEGIEAVKNSRPNLVLSDISMPDRDRFNFLRDIRPLAPHPVL